MSIASRAPSASCDRTLGVEAFEIELEAPPVPRHRDLLSHLRRAVAERMDADLVPIRLAVTSSSADGYRCELGVVTVVGLPTLAALEQGIPVVAVRENENLMENERPS